ncbi:hypothetical protein ACROYT_G021938 [Oculina patagonica]
MARPRGASKPTTRSACRPENLPLLSSEVLCLPLQALNLPIDGNKTQLRKSLRAAIQSVQHGQSEDRRTIQCHSNSEMGNLFEEVDEEIRTENIGTRLLEDIQLVNLKRVEHVSADVVLCSVIVRKSRKKLLKKEKTKNRIEENNPRKDEQGVGRNQRRIPASEMFVFITLGS